MKNKIKAFFLFKNLKTKIRSKGEKKIEEEKKKNKKKNPKELLSSSRKILLQKKKCLCNSGYYWKELKYQCSRSWVSSIFTPK